MPYILQYVTISVEGVCVNVHNAATFNNKNTGYVDPLRIFPISSSESKR